MRFLWIVIAVISFSCAHHKTHNTSRDIATDFDSDIDRSPEYDHGGHFSYEPVSSTYDYISKNLKDIDSRHSFMMLGKDQTLGYHISAFESRHQHQAIIRMKFLKLDGKPYPLTLLPKTPKNKFFSVTSVKGKEFKLLTIPKGKTQTFTAEFFDGIIGSAPGNKVNVDPVDIAVEEIYHFNRLFKNDTNDKAQYMAFKSGNAANEYIVIHMIYGVRQAPGAANNTNLDQVAVATIDGTDIEDGSILVADTLGDQEPLKVGTSYSTRYFRKGFDEKQGDTQTAATFKVVKILRSERVGILDQPQTVSPDDPDLK